MQSGEMFDLFYKTVEDYHLSDNIDAPEQNPYTEGSFEHLLYRKNWIDTIQWHLEDIIRDPEIEAGKALEIKRRIDKSNQLRTDIVEKVDDHYLELFSKVAPRVEARINTESPAWAIDRLSILALKVYHMQIEAGRKNIAKDLLEKNQLKLKVLLTQKKDLTQAIDQLLQDLAEGKRIMKVYRQMKMYNDPELNPVLYASKND